MAFTGKTAIITGGGSGIGRTCALALGKQGARVAVWDLNGVNASGVADEVKALGVRALQARVDVAEVGDIETAMRRTLDEFGRVDILVNCAGIALTPKSLLDTTPEDFQRVFAVNLKGVWHCAQLAARDMIRRRSGRIINIASQAGVVGIEERSAYGTSKAGAILLTKVLAIELAQYGITANAVAPTFIATELTRSTLENPAWRERIISRIPLGRVGEAEDVAAATVYLASPAAAMVTGHTLLVDGGWTAW